MFDIQSDVPLPKRRYRPSKYPWEQMAVDESFMVADGNLRSLRATAYAAGKRLQMKFIARKTDEGVRIWRVE